MKKKLLSKRQLFEFGQPAELTGRNLTNVAFPLGGIGTGSVSLGGLGQLRDWKIQNRPAGISPLFLVVPSAPGFVA